MGKRVLIREKAVIGALASLNRSGVPRRLLLGS
jgi:hypothetical protein